MVVVIYTKHVNQTIQENRIKIVSTKHTLSNNRHIISIPNFFSENECCAIINNSNKIGYSNVESYDRNKRDSDRLCVLDETLAMIVWLRMKDLRIMNDIESLQMIPYGFETSGKWQPKSINSINTF